MTSRRGAKGRTGPEPERVKIVGNWRDAVGKALQKPLPKDGWPDAPKRTKKRKK